MKNIPHKIFLNIGFKPDKQDDFKTLEEVTWSKDITDGNDIEYTLSEEIEVNILNELDKMCIESLSPDTFEKWETVKNGLLLSRKNLGQLLPTPLDAGVQELDKKLVTLTCMVCGEWFKGEAPKMCCNGRDCGCMGLPIDPVVCSKECYDKLPRMNSVPLPSEPKSQQLSKAWPEYFGGSEEKKGGIKCPKCKSELYIKNGYIFCSNKKCEAIYEEVDK